MPNELEPITKLITRRKLIIGSLVASSITLLLWLNRDKSSEKIKFTNPDSSQSQVLPVASSSATSSLKNKPDENLSVIKLNLTDYKRVALAKRQIKEKKEISLKYYASLIKESNNLLKQKPPSVMDKDQIPPSGDKHDYMSLATYAWPNPTTPDGLPYIIKDGEINLDNTTVSDYKNLRRLINSVYTLAYTYYFSENNTYANKAVDYLRTWFINPDTKMNPNLNYAQSVKGKNNGTATGIIDTSILPELIDAITILNSSNKLSGVDNQVLHKWFTDYLNWLLYGPRGEWIRNAPNNIGTWNYVQLGSYALFTDNNSLAKNLLDESKIKYISTQIEPNGKQPLELSRTKSWDYSIFNVRALCSLALIGKQAGVDLFRYQTPDGRSINRAIEFLRPYANSQKNWEFQQITPINLEYYNLPMKRIPEGNIEDQCYALSTYGITGNNALFNLLYPQVTN